MQSKKNKILLASIDLFMRNCFDDISIEIIAKSSEVATGTVYTYFKSKEEIIYASWNLLFESYEKAFESKIDKNISTKEKIIQFFNFHMHDLYPEDQIFMLYCNNLNVLLQDESLLSGIYLEKLLEHEYNVVLKFLQEGIQNKELLPFSVGFLIDIILSSIKGFIMQSKMKNISIEKRYDELDKIISLLLQPYNLSA